MDACVDYYTYDCGYPCLPGGCPGHTTDIPVGITVNGITLYLPETLDGNADAPLQDQPRKLDLWTRTAHAVVAALRDVPAVAPNLELPVDLPGAEPPDL